MRGHQCWYRKKFVRLVKCAGSPVLVQKEVCEVDEMCGVTSFGTEGSL